MNDIRKLTLSALATALTAAPLLLLATPASASTQLVTNCNDSGPGSLRNRIAAAASGDTIDLSHLACTRIVLTSGQIEIPQNDLRLVGRSRYAMTIDGNQRDRVFWHRGTGTLRLVRLSVAYGSRDNLVEGDQAYDAGGCILSEANVEIRYARVHHCLVFINGFLEVAGGAGGGIQAAGNVLAYYSSVFDNLSGWRGGAGGIGAVDVTLDHSQVYNNTAYLAGGVSAGGNLTATYSIIQGNHASWAGGGAMVWSGALTLRKSTVSGNVADGSRSYGQTLGGGGIFSWGSGPNRIVDSTISGNLSDIAAAASFSRSATFLNSTVAYNIDRFEQDESVDHDCGGVLDAPSLHLESTIVARSTCEAPGLAPVDIGARTTSIVGHDNLIEHALVPVPPDTLTANPRLGPLAWNGGPTRTHKPAAGSPVLEHGNNVLDLKYDQRGPGFPRVKCGLPDIGAVERKCN